MAKVTLSESKRKCNRLRSWITGEIRSKGITQQDLAKRLGLTQQAVSAKLTGKATITYEDFVRIIDILLPDTEDLMWLLGK